MHMDRNLKWQVKYERNRLRKLKLIFLGLLAIVFILDLLLFGLKCSKVLCRPLGCAIVFALVVYVVQKYVVIEIHRR